MEVFNHNMQKYVNDVRRFDSIRVFVKHAHKQDDTILHSQLCYHKQPWIYKRIINTSEYILKCACVTYAVSHCHVCVNVIIRHPHRPSTKCPCDKMVGSDVHLRQNCCRWSVPTTKWLATNCTYDETAGDEVFPRRKSMQAMKWWRWKGVYPSY